MAITLRDIDLNETALRDFHHIAATIDQFERIREVANGIGPQPGISRLAELVETKARIPPGEVRDLVRGLLHLRRSAETFNMSPTDFLGHVTDAFRQKASQEQDRAAFQLWEAKRNTICTAIASFRPDDVFLLSEKAGRITYAHQNIFKEAEVLTDLRPVFNEAATSIVQVVVTHALYLEYYDGTEARRLEVTLDAPDLATLKRLCIRAEQKAITAKEALKKTFDVVVFNEWEETGRNP